MTRNNEPANKRLAITDATLKRLMKRAHYGQTQNGVLVELLNLADRVEEYNKLVPTSEIFGETPITDKETHSVKLLVTNKLTGESFSVEDKDLASVHGLADKEAEKLGWIEFKTERIN